ncbi:CCCH-type zinc fingerfamily protein with RNA-binding domain-containing protein [Actinidia rufa]|uniref:CCCH-type zinc fingerfamily protein with RNA-binding domain-containing protein n=1 Tax=Actinidia rufa TaxID=165716 RepID=A0A7J0FU10_9ERIC|nr:CCCH-type zinc fingerfamily protein with RNA-binding domain-containing protein [Actinidia rufa]
MIRSVRFVQDPLQFLGGGQAVMQVQVRDTALSLNSNDAIPKSDVNREYFAEEHDRRARAGIDYESSYGKARPNDTILKLQRTTPYYKRNRAHICSFYIRGECTRGAECPYRHEMPETGELSQQNIKDRYYGLSSLSHHDLSLEAFYGKFRSICDEIDLNEPISSNMSKMKRVARFLSALSFSFDDIHFQILGAKELPFLVEMSQWDLIILLGVGLAAMVLVGAITPGVVMFLDVEAVILVVVAEVMVLDSMVSISSDEYRLLVAEVFATAALAQTSSYAACVATQIQWVLILVALTNHMTDTTSVLSDVSTSSRLPRVTLVDGST